MDFGLTNTQQMFRDQLRDYVTTEIVGENLDWDVDNFPDDIYTELAEMGVLGLTAPESDGSSAVGPLTSGIVYEELGRGDVGLAMLILAENLINHILVEYGTEEHRETARATAEGDTVLSFGLTEPDQGSDAQSLETTARPSSDGWAIDGEKTAITAASLADYCLVFAREEGVGIRGFLVPLDADGAEVTRYHGMGCTVSGWGQIHLDSVEVGPGARVSDENAFRIAMEGFDQSRAWIGLYSLGAAQQTIDETETYLKDREAFGKPLAGFEGPQFELAEAQTHVDCVRLKAYESLWKAEQGEPHTKDAAMVKWYAPEVSVEVIRTCLVLHGHYGYSKDFGVEKRLRDVQGQQIADGTPQVQKLVIARETFGREYLPY